MMHGGMVGVALIVLVIILILQLNKDANIIQSDDQTPLELLNERYARGEITDEEYQRKRELLK